MLRLMLLASSKNKKQTRKKKTVSIRQLLLQKQFCNTLTEKYNVLQRANAVYKLF